VELQFTLSQGDLTAAQRLGEQLPENVDAHPYCRFLCLTKAQLLIAQGELDAASEYLVAQYGLAVQSDWVYCMVAVRALQVLTAPDSDASLNYLVEALNLAVAGDFVRVFADVGEQLVPLLREAALQGVSPQYVGRILAAIGEQPEHTKPDQSGLLEPLSERELEVLRLVAAGLSNRQIGEKLIISPGTVKTHLHNICNKMGVRNRTEATSQAKELGLV
jgi:LuxR family maltose regulon positive regulatory protein